MLRKGWGGLSCLVLDEREHVVGGLAEVFVGGYFWKWNVVWEPVDGQCVTYAEGAGDIALVAAVMFDGWADVPAVDAVWSHIRTLGWSDMYLFVMLLQKIRCILENRSLNLSKSYPGSSRAVPSFIGRIGLANEHRFIRNFWKTASLAIHLKPLMK